MTPKNTTGNIKNVDQYEALKDKGYNKATAAKIANSEDAGYRGGKASDYEERTKDELYKRAQELEIEGRSKMNKDELINALRDSKYSA